MATSIAAFVGWAPQGPVTKAVLVESWSDFARQFGGLSSGNYLGYSVNQFFANGGQQAYIVRLVATTADTPSAANFAATASGIVSTLTLLASSPGQWGNNLKITVTPSTLDPTRFSVLVQLVNGGQTTTLENFSNLSVSPTDPQYVVSVIDSDSSYITFIDPTTSPPPTPAPPALPGATASGNLGTSTTGVDGDVLVPATNGNFELALLSAKGGVGINLLDRVEIFNLLCVPAETDPSTVKTLQTYCAGKRAFYIVDPPQFDHRHLRTSARRAPAAGRSSAPTPANAAYYFPWVQAPDPLRQPARAISRPAVSWPASMPPPTPAAASGRLRRASTPASPASRGLQYVLTDVQNGTTSTSRPSIACASSRSTAMWCGARAPCRATTRPGSQWKYVPIRRLALFLESSSV